MRRPPDLFLQLLLGRPLTSAEDVGALLDLLRRGVPEWYPQVCGKGDHPTELFNPRRLADAWRGRCVTWKGENGERGRVTMRARPDQAHAWLAIDGFSATTRADDAAAFLRATAAHMDADWGCVRRSERDRPASGAVLDDSLPDLHWANILGPSFASLIGGRRILSAPVELVEEVGRAVFYVQLTQRIDDDLGEARDAATRHLGAGASPPGPSRTREDPRAAGARV